MIAPLDADPWPGANVLAFMLPGPDLTIACPVDNGGSDLCGWSHASGRVQLSTVQHPDLGPVLWPDGGCSAGHALKDVEVAYALEASDIARGAPPSPDPVQAFVRALYRAGRSSGIDRVKLRRIILVTAKAQGISL